MAGAGLVQCMSQCAGAAIRHGSLACREVGTDETTAVPRVANPGLSALSKSLWAWPSSTALRCDSVSSCAQSSASGERRGPSRDHFARITHAWQVTICGASANRHGLGLTSSNARPHRPTRPSTCASIPQATLHAGCTRLRNSWA